MVILFNTEGRFGHQLSQFATLMACSKEFNRPFYHLKFNSRFGNIFDSNSIKLISKPFTSNIILLYSLYKILKLFSIKRITFMNTEFFITHKKGKELVFDDTINQLFLSSAKYVVTDYVFNDVPKLIKYKEEIKKLLFPNALLEKETTNFILKLRLKYTTVVGVHIRRDDFKDFENGRFYFNDMQYDSVLNRFIEIININQHNIIFVLCSDESINVDNFAGLNINYNARNYHEDFFILTQCDYIIATRSIFSIMANYLSNNKIYQIIDINKQFKMEDFFESKELLSTKYDLKQIKDFI